MTLFEAGKALTNEMIPSVPPLPRSHTSFPFFCVSVSTLVSVDDQGWSSYSLSRFPSLLTVLTLQIFIHFTQSEIRNFG